MTSGTATSATELNVALKPYGLNLPLRSAMSFAAGDGGGVAAGLAAGFSADGFDASSLMVVQVCELRLLPGVKSHPCAKATHLSKQTGNL